MKFFIKKLTQDAIIPKKAHKTDAGYDIYSNTEIIIKKNSRALIPTGFSMAIPDGYYGNIKSRSGLASKFSIDVGAGTIDSGYRGQVFVLLVNNGSEDFQVRNGDKIAQLLNY